MATVESFINCPKCAQKYECLMLEGAHVIIEEFNVWKRNRRFTGRITFYESPYLASQFGRPIKTHPVRLYRAEDKKKSTYDYLISCPVCGQFTMDYTGVPKGIDVFYGPDRGLGLMVIPLENIPEECIIAEHHENKSDEVASEILRKGLTKGQG